MFSKQKKGSSQILFEDTYVVQDKAKKGHDHGPFLMFKKVLSSTEDTGHFRGLGGFEAKDLLTFEAKDLTSRPMPKTSKCVLEDFTWICSSYRKAVVEQLNFIFF